MMIAWPDTWYHTSGDTADKADPTQLKRAAIIGAAGAYTVAAAGADMAARIAGETASNGTRRLGHQLVVGLETLNGADAGSLAEAYKTARWTIEAAVMNEKETLDSLLELAPGDAALAGHIGRLKQAVQAAGDAQVLALEAHADAAARRLGVKRGTIVLSDLEKRAARSVPRPTARVRENGYREYQKSITAVPAAERAKYPVAGKDLALANANELQLLIDGRRSVLDIKKMLDAQYERKSTLQAIFNHIEVLKLAGLVETR